MSIFGTGKPKVEYGATPTTVNIDYCEILNIDYLQDNIINKSKVAGEIGHYEKGVQVSIEIKVNLWKETNISTKFNSYLALKNQDLTFYLHRDSGAFDDSSGDPVMFRMIEFKPIYLTQHNFEDVLIMKFISTDYVDLDQHIKP